MPKRGDRVLAEWPAEVEWWYPGVVCGDEGGRLVIQFDDGDRSVLTPRQTSPLFIAQGLRVYGNWQGEGSYYPGRITSVEGDAIHIAYDDGDEEWTSVCAIRVHRSDVPSVA